MRRIGQVVVDHQVDVADVQAAGGDVGRYQDVGPQPTKGIHGAIADVLREVALQVSAVVAEVAKIPAELTNAMLGAAEDDRRALVVAKQPAQGSKLLGPAHAQQAVLQSLLGRAGHDDPDGIVEVTRNHPADPFGHGRRRQDDLWLIGHFDDAFDVRGEAGIEHLVALVEDEQLHPAQGQAAAGHHVEDAAGGADHDVNTLAEGQFLGAVADTTVDQRRLEAGFERLEDTVHLDGELPGRGDDQGAGPGAANRDQPLDERQHVGERLARTGRRLDDDITAGQHRRNGFHLNRDRAIDRAAGKCGQ